MKRTIASLLSLALLLGLLAGCSGAPRTIAAVNGQNVAIGYYTVQSMMARVELENSQGDNYPAFISQTGSDGRTFAEVYNDSYRKAFATFYAIKLQFEALGLSIDDSRLKAYDVEYSTFRANFRSDADYRTFLRKCGMSEAEHKQIYKELIYDQEILYAHFFDPDKGTEVPNEAAVRAYFDELVQLAVKHILFYVPTTDQSGNALSEAEIAENRQKAREEAADVLARIQAGTLSFNTAMNELSDDSDLKSYPGGYGFLPNEEGFPACFTEAATTLAPGEMGIYESDYGVHIIQTIEPSALFSAQQSLYQKALQNEIFTRKCSEWVDQLQISYNDAALAYCDFGKSELSNIYLASENS